MLLTGLPGLPVGVVPDVGAEVGPDTVAVGPGTVTVAVGPGTVTVAVGPGTPVAVTVADADTVLVAVTVLVGQGWCRWMPLVAPLEVNRLPAVTRTTVIAAMTEAIAVNPALAWVPLAAPAARCLQRTFLRMLDSLTPGEA